MQLVLGEVHSKFLGRGINSSILVHSLDSLRAQSQTNATSQTVRVESLPLQIHLLDLVDALVGEGNDASLAVRRFAEEVALSLSHDEGGACGLVGGLGGAGEYEGGAGEGGGGGDNQGEEEGGDSGFHGDASSDDYT
eukprot:CAMPEP_0202008862 /NCGR_PEP_ID=MMETSP0905-20130828/14910_1 /ASSEMBLY_ACC=CAM_ASM_000554 /TAXON_ID=420261 /ORGANISM="Thalassiosira antarctica, Strain CCMP982" /LENGTH=136 /DNA_ID=CAMNT_0048567187 /DNA_START=103 /DNA_END=513 /DNA_ORIENTATION=+